MNYKKISFVSSIVSGLLFCNLAFAEEVVYLKSDVPCTVEAFSAPDSAPSGEKLRCGEKATVLERRGPSVKIQIGEDNQAL